MSYALHWDRPEEIEPARYARIKADMLAVLEALPATYPEGRGVESAQGQPIKLAGGSGEEPFSADDLDEGEFAFNGLRPRWGETFWFPRVGRDHGFCKTGGEPYELGVFACALVAQYHMPGEFSIEPVLSTRSWDPALDVFSEVAGGSALEQMVERWSEETSYLAVQILSVRPDVAEKVGLKARVDELLEALSGGELSLIGLHHPAFAAEHFGPDAPRQMVGETQSDWVLKQLVRQMPPLFEEHSSSVEFDRLRRRLGEPEVIRTLPGLARRSLPLREIGARIAEWLPGRHPEVEPSAGWGDELLQYLEGDAELVVEALAAYGADVGQDVGLAAEDFTRMLGADGGEIRQRALLALARWQQARERLGMLAREGRGDGVTAKSAAPVQGPSR